LIVVGVRFLASGVFLIHGNSRPISGSKYFLFLFFLH
jgi:hypothetical protein